MNNRLFEILAEQNREQILEAAEHIRLEKRALESHVYRPGRFNRTMVSVANWMIATGKQLRERYEIPAVNCDPPISQRFAH